MRNRNHSNLAGISAAAAIGATLALVAAPLGGMLFVAVLAGAITALVICVWALTRNASGGDRASGVDGGGVGSVGGSSHDDGMPTTFTTSTLFDSNASSADDGQRSCRFDAASDSASSYDSGSSGSDCGSSSSDSGGGGGGD